MIEQIVETKKKEVEALKTLELAPRTKRVIPFALKKGVNIIAELKRKSPSAGEIVEARRMAEAPETLGGSRRITVPLPPGRAAR